MFDFCLWPYCYDFHKTYGKPHSQLVRQSHLASFLNLYILNVYFVVPGIYAKTSSWSVSFAVSKHNMFYFFLGHVKCVFEVFRTIAQINLRFASNCFIFVSFEIFISKITTCKMIKKQ